jgi:hypothetical protein
VAPRVGARGGRPCSRRAHRNGRPLSEPAGATPAPVTIDVAVLYTPTAVTALGGLNQTNFQVASHIGISNTILANSGLGHISFRLVYAGQTTNYDPQGVDLQTQLFWLADPDDGNLDEAAGSTGVRGAWGADLVQVWSDGSAPSSSGSECGQGASLLSIGGDPAAAWSVVDATNQRCLDAMAPSHELFHNLGANHQRSAYPSGANPLAPTTAPFSNAYAFLDRPSGWHQTDGRGDVMVTPRIEDWCEELPGGQLTCQVLPYLSGPDVVVNGEVIGSATEPGSTV